MIYLEKYERYVDENGKVYRKSKDNEIIECRQNYTGNGYLGVRLRNKKYIRVHRMIIEAYIGEIPPGYEVDHINRVKTDNRLCNLRIVSHSENNLNKKMSTFFEKYYNHYKLRRNDNKKLYQKEWYLYKKYGKLSFEE